MTEVTNRDCMMRIRENIKSLSGRAFDESEIMHLISNIIVRGKDWVLQEDDAYYTPIMERLGFTATHKGDKVYYELK